MPYYQSDDTFHFRTPLPLGCIHLEAGSCISGSAVSLSQQAISRARPLTRLISVLSLRSEFETPHLKEREALNLVAMKLVEDRPFSYTNFPSVWTDEIRHPRVSKTSSKPKIAKTMFPSWVLCRAALISNLTLLSCAKPNWKGTAGLKFPVQLFLQQEGSIWVRTGQDKGPDLLLDSECNDDK